MKVPRAESLDITQLSNKPAGFEVNSLPSGGFALKIWSGARRGTRPAESRKMPAIAQGSKRDSRLHHGPR
jgi:hypothetical protein